MHLSWRLLAYAIDFLLLFSSGCESRKPKDAVLLSQVKSITFQKDKKTTHRRVPAVPQLTCIGGSGRGLFEPEAIRCTNAGSSYSSADVEWTCEASLPVEFKLGSTNVVCEGYDNSDDEYVLAGSCGLEYRLILTDAGAEKYGRSRSRTRDDEPESSGRFSYIFWLIFLAVCCWMFWSAFFRDHGPQVGEPDRRDRPRRGFGDGGGRGDDDDPPPPYTPRAPKPRPMYQSSYDQWRPGFWSGTAAGAAAGYTAGRYAGRNPSQFGGPSSSFWGSDPGVGPSTRPSRQPSGSRHTSTGFGSTSRR